MVEKANSPSPPVEQGGEALVVRQNKRRQRIASASFKLFELL
jgi:hypothetical protein